MNNTSLALAAEEVTQLLRRAFSDTPGDQLPVVTQAEPGRVHVVRTYGPGMMRPGGVISGPTLMGLADTAAYALILAHQGEVLMAVTSSLVMNFLRGAQPGDIHAEATFLRMGRRICVCDVRIWTETPERIAAQATVTYAMPGPPA